MNHISIHERPPKVTYKLTRNHQNTIRKQSNMVACSLLCQPSAHCMFQRWKMDMEMKIQNLATFEHSIAACKLGCTVNTSIGMKRYIIVQQSISIYIHLRTTWWATVLEVQCWLQRQLWPIRLVTWKLSIRLVLCHQYVRLTQSRYLSATLVKGTIN